MRKPVSQVVPSLIPVAQYVRMSDEQQQYSIENQVAAINEYAVAHGFAVVKTYSDSGKSGVAAKHRKGLRDLLKDVVSGEAPYRAILVYDVSRWGRFPNNDEAAHYEFLCSRSGIPLHYCAEPFSNDSTASSSLLKALKRSMAAEFSRELSVKVHRGKTRIVQLGYWVGGQAGYGYRRLMLSAEGKLKQVMKSGEYKNLTTDRVILIPGPKPEVQAVRLMFSMAIEKNGSSAIARELKRRNILRNGKYWTPTDVRNVLRNPKYAGWNVWNRGSEQLQQNRTKNPPQLWIMKPKAFAAIVDQETFDRAQACRPKKEDFLWSDEEMLRKVRRLLKNKGRLSERLLLRARGMPSCTTLHQHFGTYRQLYERVGYELAPERHRTLRLFTFPDVTYIQRLFPEAVTVTHLPKRTRSMLLINNTFMVSVLLCRSKFKRNKWCWVVEPNAAERDYITLICLMNSSHNSVLHYFLIQHMDGFKRALLHDSFLRSALPLKNLSDFYDGVKTMWAARACTIQSQN